MATTQLAEFLNHSREYFRKDIKKLEMPTHRKMRIDLLLYLPEMLRSLEVPGWRLVEVDIGYAFICEELMQEGMPNFIRVLPGDRYVSIKPYLVTTPQNGCAFADDGLLQVSQEIETVLISGCCAATEIIKQSEAALLGMMKRSSSLTMDLF